MKQVAQVIACVLCAGVTASAFSEPYLPKSRTEVIYEAKAEWDAGLVRPSPVGQDVDQAVASAAKFLDLGERRDDPRFYGYAQAVLKPWKDDPNPPRKVLQQRVRIAQSFHNFDAALADINRILREQPSDVHALLSASLIHQDGGRIDAAKAMCDRVALSSHAYWSLCAADLASVTGGADKAYALLDQNVAQLRDPRTQAWAFGLLAQIADRRGRRDLAIANFDRSLQLAPDAVALRKNYLNFLYENRDVVGMSALLADATEDGPYSFHLCLLRKLQGVASASRCQDALAEKYQRAKDRGDNPHYFEEIVFALDLSNDPAHAFELARQNWSINKKPSDAVLLAKASTAIRNKDALLSLSSWKRETNLEDATLDRLLRTP